MFINLVEPLIATPWTLSRYIAPPYNDEQFVKVVLLITYLTEFVVSLFIDSSDILTHPPVLFAFIYLNVEPIILKLPILTTVNAAYLEASASLVAEL